MVISARVGVLLILALAIQHIVVSGGTDEWCKLLHSAVCVDSRPVFSLIEMIDNPMIFFSRTKHTSCFKTSFHSLLRTSSGLRTT